jgi:hypothetical protein
MEMTLREAAKVCSISRHAYYAVRSYKIKSHKIKGEWVIYLSDVLEYKKIMSIRSEGNRL